MVKVFCSRRQEVEHKTSIVPQKTALNQPKKYKNLTCIMINLPKREGRGNLTSSKGAICKTSPGKPSTIAVSYVQKNWSETRASTQKK